VKLYRGALFGELMRANIQWGSAGPGNVDSQRVMAAALAVRRVAFYARCLLAFSALAQHVVGTATGLEGADFSITSGACI
jgi:hypothetical protein